MGIKTLVSAQNLHEVDLILKEPPDILDLKNPLEGSLGAPKIPMIQEVGKKLNSFNTDQEELVEYSVAIGDFPNLPGTASMSAFGVAQLNVNYIKIGLFGPKTTKEGIYLTQTVVNTVHLVNQDIKVVVVGYADKKRFNESVDPLKIPEIASSGGADIAMLDTKIKNNKSLFSNLKFKEVENFVESCRQKQISVALAGSLQFSDMDKIKMLQPDIVGVRSMVCEHFDRLHGEIQPQLIRALKNSIE